MSRVTSFLEESSSWISELELNMVPNSALLAAKVLVVDTLAAAFSSLNTTPGRRICRGLQSSVAVPELFSIESVLLDHDSTLLYYGHLGHGVVAVTLASGHKNIDGARLVESILAGVEVGARLAASLSLSRTRGQMLSVAHSVAAAAGLGKLLDLDSGTLFNALALSLAYIIKPTRAGFTTPGKVLAAANPLSHGIRAFKLAVAGERGSSRVFDSLLEEWGGIVLRAPLGGFGSRWHIETVSVKPWPACSYAQTAIDAALKLSEALDVGSVREIIVEENALTYYMDKTFEPSIDGPRTSFTTLQFYTPYIIAYTLLNRGFSRTAYEPRSISDKHVWRLASIVRRVHNPDLTARILKEPLPFGVAIWEMGALKTLFLLAKLLGAGSLGVVLKHSGILRGSPLDSVDFNSARKIMPASIIVKTDNGSFEASSEIVKGFHGTGIEAKLEVAVGKLMEAASTIVNRDELDMVKDILLRVERAGIDEVNIVSSIISKALRC